MQQELEVSPIIFFILQDFSDVVIGVAGMDGQWQPSQSRSADMGAEVLLLYFPRGTVIVVVQARTRRCR